MESCSTLLLLFFLIYSLFLKAVLLPSLEFWGRDVASGNGVRTHPWRGRCALLVAQAQSPLRQTPAIIKWQMAAGLRQEEST